jgi:hypothetical protein
MSTQPKQRIKGFNYEQPFTRKGDTPTVEFSRFLQQIVALLNFQGRLALPTGATVGASPYTITNATANDQSVIVKGGTVSKVEFTRDGTTFIDVGTVAGMFALSPLDSLRVTYTVVPTITVIVR